MARRLIDVFEQWRDRHGYTEREAAEIVGISSSRMHQILNEMSEPYMDELVCFEKIFASEKRA
jgi:DNA-binding XRE family transcriptional regulator